MFLAQQAYAGPALPIEGCGVSQPGGGLWLGSLWGVSGLPGAGKGGGGSPADLLGACLGSWCTWVGEGVWPGGHPPGGH